MEHTWELNYEKIRSYFPLAQFNADTAELYKRKLRALNQSHLCEAIEQVKMKYSTFADNPPELKWFLSEYSSVEQSKRPAEGKYSQPEKWWVDFETKSNNGNYMLGASQAFPTQATAESFAKESGGRVRSQGIGYCEASDEQLIAELKLIPRADIGEAIAILRTQQLIPTEPLPSDFTKWKPAWIGRVSAQIYLNSKKGKINDPMVESKLAGFEVDVERTH